VRNEQRYRCGMALAESRDRTALAWFTSPLGDDLCALLAEAAGRRG
jgi:hypothetical protein